ncbi:site-specific tyrosine recombinase XerD [Streptococcus sp. sy018]|nr:site-specific tyrosine recombinase XerD [Streptococcus sp. sy018]
MISNIIMTLAQNHLKNEIAQFLKQRQLAKNSYQAYAYDLDQFCQVVAEQIDRSSLSRYEQFLLPLKASAKNRKLSVVNQFLYYLYQSGQLQTFYRLTSQEKLPKPSKETKQVDLSGLYQEKEKDIGQLLALFIVELGLTPSQILSLEVGWFELELRILRLVNKQQVRILPLSERFLTYFSLPQNQTYVFEHGGNPYSRQWFHRVLTTYLKNKGLTSLTAHSLREEYIKRQLAAGLDLSTLAKRLGLKSPITLEKYYH